MLRLLSMLFIVSAVSFGFMCCGGDGEEPNVNPSNPGNSGNTGGGNNNATIQVQTGNVSDISESSAVLSASFTPSNSRPDAIGFLIGTSLTLTIDNRDRDLVIFDISSPFSITVSGLQPQTTYYYRAYALTRANNNYTYGDVKSFSTSDNGNNNQESQKAKGNGTISNPYNVAAITEIASRLNAGEIDATDYYFKGIVSEIVHNFGTDQDSTATFYISDENNSGKFFCNYVRYLYNEGYWQGGDISIGDKVVICGKITKGENGVIGTSRRRAYTYSINDNTGATDAIEYIIDGKSFRTILVEGGGMEPFYIMQTEWSPKSDVIINNRVFAGPDLNRDGYLIRSEFKTFLTNLRRMTGYRFRLPTKDEWQYAARGGAKSNGFIYSGSNTIDDVAWYNGNSSNKEHGIAQKQPNELGLYDMSGNYAELTNLRNYDEYNVDRDICGGSFEDAQSDCTIYSWKAQPQNGKLGSTGVNNLNTAPLESTIRLVYTKR